MKEPDSHEIATELRGIEKKCSCRKIILYNVELY